MIKFKVVTKSNKIKVTKFLSLISLLDVDGSKVKWKMRPVEGKGGYL